MMQLKIEYVPVDSIKPYENNAKEHPDYQVKQIARSIQEFGFNDPIAVSNGIIVEGHGRLLAAQQLGLENVPVIRLDTLTEEQRKAYTLIHNQLTLNSDFDLEILSKELESITDIDMSEFDFDIDLDEIQSVNDVSETDGYYGDERERTYDRVNLNQYDENRTAGFYQMPIIKTCNYIPDSLIGFNYAKSAKEFDTGVHFFVDDYQFERVWNNPLENIERLKKFQCVLTPDFSLYMDMPMAMKIWNVYMSRLIGQLCQDAGMNVIPTLSWSEKETYRFCFDGLETGGTVAVSTVGVMRDKSAKAIFCDGMKEALQRLQPKTVVLYGSQIDFDFGSVAVKHIPARGFQK